MNKKIIYLFCLVFGVIACNSPSIKSEIAERIISKHATLLDKNTRQLVVVYCPTKGKTYAELLALEKTENGWEIVFEPVPAGIGRNGFADLGEKREGDGKTPSGLFQLGQLFTYEKDVDTKMPYLQSTDEDKWIDDPESPDYNKHVRGETDAKSFENLLLESDYYKYCLVIEYNTNPVVKGKGSAIFFHLNFQLHEPTAGCVAISELEMLKILKWMNPDANPKILMGN